MTETKQELIDELLTSINMHKKVLEDSAHIEIDGNRVLSKGLVQGFHMDVEEQDEGIEATIRVEKGVALKKPVHLCFGMIPESGIQRIKLHVHIEENAKVNFLAHCTFPNAVDVQHLMDADIKVDAGGEYSYFERHVHSDNKGIKVVPKARIELAENAKFRTEFELLEGRVGLMDIDYESVGAAGSVLEMMARISARGDDKIKIREAAVLAGEYARGVLKSSIAVRDQSTAEIYNDLKALAAYSRGHVDCKEIVQGDASARAVPIVQVKHPKAHVTHEAAIGSVDSKQLQTLMARGLDEEEAVDLIIQGMLS